MWLAALAAYGFLVLIARSLDRDREIRFALLSAALIWSVLLVALTEGLGWVGMLTAQALGWAWGALAALTLLLALRLRALPRLPLKLPEASAGPHLAMLAMVSTVVSITGLVALLATPNNSDSLVYRLSRVMHWVQQQSLDFYPTHILPQLHHGPFAEMVLLHIQLLVGFDRAFNLVQWFSMLASLVCVSLIAERLGADTRGQWLAATLCALLPMGILQATSTQNSYVVSLWIALCVLLALRFRDGLALSDACLLGIAAGLAILTKGTALVFGPPVALILLTSPSFWRRLRPGTAVLATGLTVLSITALCFGYFSRNYALYGSVLGPGKEQDGAFSARYTNDEVSLPVLVSNLMRNAGLQIGTGIGAIDHATTAAIRGVHQVLNIDPEDPRSTWPGTRFQVEGRVRSEDSTGNLVHVTLICLTLAALGRDLRWKRAVPWGYLLAVLGGVLMFSLLLRWQPWHSRLHFTSFVLWTPLLGLMLGRLRTVPVLLVLGLTTGWSVPFLVQDAQRPLLGDRSILQHPWERQLFQHTPELEDAYIQAARLARVTDCDQLGLYIGPDDAEYPWWLLTAPLGPSRRIEHVGVMNDSGTLHRRQPFAPCLVFARTRPVAPVTQIDGREYEPLRAFGPVTVLQPRGQPLPLAARLEAAVPAQWVADQSTSYRLELTNRGTRAWRATGPGKGELSVVISATERAAPDQELRLALPADLEPGATLTLPLEVPAPSAPGKYLVRHRLVRDGTMIHPDDTAQSMEVIEAPSRQQRRRR